MENLIRQFAGQIITKFRNNVIVPGIEFYYYHSFLQVNFKNISISSVYTKCAACDENGSVFLFIYFPFDLNMYIS